MGGFFDAGYGGDWYAMSTERDDVVEGELAPPATMIGHEPAAIEEPEPAVVEAIEPVPPPPAPESAAARYERERVAAWIRARLIAYPLGSLLLLPAALQCWPAVAGGRERRSEGPFSRRVPRRMA